MSEGKLYAANETFFFEEPAGVPHQVRKGVTLVREGHELLKKYPQFFDEAATYVDYDVETATAEPGEKRGADAPPPPKESEKKEPAAATSSSASGSKPGPKPAEKKEDSKGAS